MLIPTKPAPQFRGKAVIDGAFQTVSLQDYLGKYVVLFFYPADFTFVCPTEIIAFSEHSEYCHLAWTKMERNAGGLGPMKIPILADPTKTIARSYGVLDDVEGNAFRGLFIIDTKGILRQITVNDRSVGRSVDEVIRLLDAFQFVEKHGEVCPANWKAGKKTIKPDPSASKEFFSGST
ncbi:unnamed protein product [Trichobilharzia szidati]|nr:unnamed protein product [Trichobilharzia szidati]